MLNGTLVKWLDRAGWVGTQQVGWLGSLGCLSGLAGRGVMSLCPSGLGSGQPVDTGRTPVGRPQPWAHGLVPGPERLPCGVPGIAMCGRRVGAQPATVGSPGHRDRRPLLESPSSACPTGLAESRGF